MGFPSMKRNVAVGAGLGLGVILIAACITVNTTSPTTPGPTGRLTPYYTPSPSQAPEYAPLKTSPTPIPEPTATPFTYTIARGDTLLAIAYKFGVTVDKILEVNPGITPRFLSVDTQLIIPIGAGGQIVIPSPTPLPVILGLPQCYPVATGGAWCFVPVLNEQTLALESPSAQVTLHARDGQMVASHEAFSLLNLIPPGQSIPLVAFFPPPLPEGFLARRELRTAYLMDPQDGRYLSARLEELEEEIGDQGGYAVVRGQVVVDGEGEAPIEALVWVAAIAYGPNAEVAGVRRWEREVQLIPGEVLPFEMRVFSLGPDIQRVEVAVEARPLDQIEQR